MAEAPRPNPGWYPDPDMAGTQRYWDGVGWSDHVAPAATATATSPEPRGSGARLVVIIAGGILLALLVVWFVAWLRTPSDLDCAIQRTDVASGKRAAVDSSCVGR